MRIGRVRKNKRSTEITLVVESSEEARNACHFLNCTEQHCAYPEYRQRGKELLFQHLHPELNKLW